jgi:peptidoglycan L-alanyl-D-glutamate endopeptidase CwlK
MTTLVHLPPPPPEPPADTSLDHLAPGFRRRVAAMLADMETRGFDPVIAEAFRSDERQAWLWGFGRDYDDDRGIVTNAPNGIHSWHRFGLAVDVISKRKGYNAAKSFWDALVGAALRQGLSSGALWPRFKDEPHVQFGPPMRQSPSSRAADLLASGGVEAVWAEVGAL